MHACTHGSSQSSLGWPCKPDVGALCLLYWLQGNVILTDHTYQVLTLLRSHRDDDKGLSIMAKHPYPMHAIRLRQPLLLDALHAALTAAAAAAPAAANGNTGQAVAAAGNSAAMGAAYDDEQQEEDYADADEAAATPVEVAAAAPAGKKGKKGKDAGSGPTLKAVVGDLLPYGPAIAEHCCLTAGLQPQQQPAAQQLSQEQELALFGAVQQFEAWLAALDQGAVAEGFVAAVQAAAGGPQAKGKQAANGAGAAAAAADGQQAAAAAADKAAGLVYQDYNPLRLQQLARAQQLLTFGTFDDALDEFYSKVRGTGSMHRVAARSGDSGGWYCARGWVKEL